MGSRGPIGKPPELKLLDGRGHRRIDLSTRFRPEIGCPPMPKHLGKEARKAWKRLAPELVHYGLLSAVDADAFSMLCQTIGRVEIIERSIAARQAELEADGKDPLAMMSSDGAALSPVYRALNRETAKMLLMLSEFGLTPARRGRVTTGVRAKPKPLGDGPGWKPADPGFAGFS